VSSKGIDIFALKDDIAAFIELKSHVEITTTLKKDAIAQFIANASIVHSFTQKTSKNPHKVLYLLLMYERDNYISIYDTTHTERRYEKERLNIVQTLENILTKEFGLYFYNDKI